MAGTQKFEEQRKGEIMSWRTLSDLFFRDIVVMVGRESLEDLHKCRQVCQDWKVMISQMNKCKKNLARIRFGPGPVFPIYKKMLHDWKTPSLPDLITLAFWAHHGFLNSLPILVLTDVDLASIPTEYLSSLGSCVKTFLEIGNLNTCDLSPFLGSLKCDYLRSTMDSKRVLGVENMSSEEIRALNQVMVTCPRCPSFCYINKDKLQAINNHKSFHANLKQVMSGYQGPPLGPNEFYLKR